MTPKKVIHIADIHIRNMHRHEEYAEQFDKFFEKCREALGDTPRDEARIVIAGDLVHSKNTVSNEVYILVSAFIRRLEEIAPVLVISGNHDLVVSNNSRVDTLTAIFSTANFQDSTFLDYSLGKQSGCYVDGDVVWALYSIHDDYAYPGVDSIRVEYPNSKVIGLYHGTVVGAEMPNGTKASSGLEDDKFSGCDLVMAGHIHKRQDVYRGGVRVCYPGSLIQQDFGETVSGHGFMVWDLETMEGEFVELESEYGFYSFEIDSETDIDENKEKAVNL